jgi:hypothetical protein
LLLRPHAAPRRGPHAGDQLLHRERLHEVVVRPELERVHTVVLRSARAHDHDRRADPLVAGLLDEPPSVDAGQHQIEHAHRGVLEAEARDALLAAVDPERVEPRSGEMARHALRDDLVVLDDQHLGHTDPQV